jgi:hypothetical protein
MTTIFWDCILLIDFKERNTTVNGTYYASAAADKKLKRNDAGNLPLVYCCCKTMLLSIKGAVRDCGFTEVDHPDMTLYDYVLFPALKKDLRGSKLKTNDELQSAVLEQTSRVFS